MPILHVAKITKAEEARVDLVVAIEETVVVAEAVKVIAVAAVLLVVILAAVVKAEEVLLKKVLAKALSVNIPRLFKADEVLDTRESSAVECLFDIFDLLNNRVLPFSTTNVFIDLGSYSVLN